MPVNKNYNGNEIEKEQSVKLHTVWVCPGCGKTVHADRRYCDCHADLSSATARLTEKPAEIDRCNFETSGLACCDCPEDCDWCASYGSPVTNKQGFGGKDCRHNGGTARCYCCQAQVKLALEIVKDGFGIMRRVTSGTPVTFADVAEFIRAEMEKPVLARINRAARMTGCKEGNYMIVDPNPVMKWMAGNAVVKPDPNNNYKPLKEYKSSLKRIDGVVTAVMSVGRASGADGGEPGSIERILALF